MMKKLFRKIRLEIKLELKKLILSKPLMNKLIALVLAELILFAPFNIGYAAPKATDRQIQETQQNLLSNGGFENGKANWTVSGSSTLTFDTSSPAENKVNGIWNASATGEFLTGEFKLIPPKLKNNKCMVVAWYRATTLGIEHVKVQAIQDFGGITILAEEFLVVTQDWKPAVLQFPCPETGGLTIAPRLESFADAAPVELESWYMGIALNEFKSGTAQIAFAGSYEATANCIWSRTSTTDGAFGTDADCPAISTQISASGVVVDSTDDDLPTLKFISLPPGNYKLIWRFNSVVSTAGTNATFILRDTTNSVDLDSFGASSLNANENQATSLIATFTQNVAGAHDFEIFGSSSAGSINVSAQSSTEFLARSSIVLTRYPLQSETAFLFNQANWQIDATISGAVESLGFATVGSKIAIDNAAWAMTLGAGSKAAFIPCAGTEIASGLTCTAAEQQGISFINFSAGIFEVCAEFHIKFAMSSSSSLDVDVRDQFSLHVTENNAQTDKSFISNPSRNIETHFDSGAATVVNAAGFGQDSITLCHKFKFDSVDQQTVRLKHTITQTNIGRLNLHDIFDNVRWTVNIVDERKGGVSFKNLTESANKAGSKDFSYSITWQGTGIPIVEFDSAGIVDNIVDNAAGDVTINYVSGTAVNPIVCLCGPRDDSPLFCNLITRPPTNTASRFRIYNPSGTLTDPNGADEGIDVRCSEQK